MHVYYYSSEKNVTFLAEICQFYVKNLKQKCRKKVRKKYVGLSLLYYSTLRTIRTGEIFASTTCETARPTNMGSTWSSGESRSLIV